MFVAREIKQNPCGSCFVGHPVVSRMYQESLNEVSFAILLRESHRSDPSRRRACFSNLAPLGGVSSCQLGSLGGDGVHI